MECAELYAEVVLELVVYEVELEQLETLDSESLWSLGSGSLLGCGGLAGIGLVGAVGDWEEDDGWLPSWL